MLIRYFFTLFLYGARKYTFLFERKTQFKYIDANGIVITIIVYFCTLKLNEMLPPFFLNKSYWVQLLFLLLFIVGGVTIFTSLALIAGKMSGFEVGTREYFYIVQTISAFGTFLVPALLFGYCTSKEWFSYSDADQVVSPPMVGYVVVLSLFILPVIAFLGYVNEQIILPDFMHNIEVWMQRMEQESKALMQVLTANSNFLILAVNIGVMALLPALFEEFLFRGTIQQFFFKWFANKPVAIIVTAFIFSAIHLQFYGFLPRFLLGIYLGYLFVWSNSLWLPIIAHFMHNTNSLIFDYSAQQRGIDLESLDPSQLTGFYPAVLFCTFCVVMGIYFLRKRRFWD